MHPIEVPEVEWKPCRCNDMSMGLSHSDYIEIMMFLDRERNCIKDTLDSHMDGEDLNETHLLPPVYP